MKVIFCSSLILLIVTLRVSLAYYVHNQVSVVPHGPQNTSSAAADGWTGVRHNSSLFPHLLLLAWRGPSPSWAAASHMCLQTH